MKLFIDTAELADIETIAGWGVLSGVTTNPTLISKVEGEPDDIYRRVCELVDGPVSAEVVSRDVASMVAEGRALRTLHDHVIVKVPFSAAGLEATRVLTAEGHKVNMTLVFSATQALLTAEAGATYISCFMGRLDDISINSTDVVREIVETLRPGGYTAQVLAASIRGPEHVVTAARLGCEVATVPGKVLKQLLGHPLTSAGIDKFESDWKSRPEFAQWLQGLVQSQPANA
jgi:transaldolase